MQKITINQFKKDMQNISKTALRQFYKNTGADINKIKRVYENCGRFTYNQVLKDCEVEYQETFFILAYGKENEYREENSLYLYDNFLNSPKKLKDVVYSKDVFDNFWRKIDAEDFRKKEDKKYYVIVLDKKAINQVKDENCYIKINKNERVKVLEVNYALRYNNNNKYVYRYDVLDYIKGEKKIFENFETESDDRYLVLDKSGYNRYLYIEELKNKLRVYKNKKALERFKKIDISKDIENLKAFKNNLKNKLIEELKKIDNFNYDNLDVYYDLVNKIKWRIYYIDGYLEKLSNDKINNDKLHYEKVSSLLKEF